MFEPAEIRKMLDGANPTLKAMILLGVNCGFGPSDLARLPIKATDLKAGWIDFPRPKAGVHRRCPLWPETSKAIRSYRASRREPTDTQYADRLFITKHGGPFAKDEVSDNGIVGGEFLRLVVRLGLHRHGLGIYTLRHVFETVAGDSRDQVAVDFIMGHSRDDMASVYRERISDDRLRAVVEHARKWLFAAKEHEVG